MRFRFLKLDETIYQWLDTTLITFVKLVKMPNLIFLVISPGAYLINVGKKKMRTETWIRVSTRLTLYLIQKFRTNKCVKNSIEISVKIPLIYETINFLLQSMFNLSSSGLQPHIKRIESANSWSEILNFSCKRANLWSHNAKMLIMWRI